MRRAGSAKWGARWRGRRGQIHVAAGRYGRAWPAVENLCRVLEWIRRQRNDRVRATRLLSEEASATWVDLPHSTPQALSDTAAPLQL